MTEQHKSDIWSEVAGRLVDELATTRANAAELSEQVTDLDFGIADLETRVTDLLAQLEQRESEIVALTAELSAAQAGGIVWHPASEQPERWPVLAVAVYRDGDRVCTVRTDLSMCSEIVRWSYIPGVSK